MVPVPENPQEATRAYPGTPARHAYTDPGRYNTQCPHCWFSRGTAPVVMQDSHGAHKFGFYLIYVHALKAE